MPITEKGVYPLWMNDDEIITQVLNQIVKRGGTIPYSFVINSEHDTATQDRMKKIINIMIEDKLLFSQIHEEDDFVLGLQGGVAARLGYRKFKRINMLRRFYAKVNKYVYKFYIPIIALIFLILILHYFKII